jgi:hypothetical protein
MYHSRLLAHGSMAPARVTVTPQDGALAWAPLQPTSAAAAAREPCVLLLLVV